MIKSQNHKYLFAGGLIVATLLSLSSSVSAVDTVNSNVHLAVPVSCSISGNLDTPHTKNVNPGTYNTDIGTTTFEVLCNDSATYSIYAIGYSNEEYGNTKLLATIGGVLSPSNDIVTGLNTSSGVSNWSMKLQGVAGHYPPTIVNNYDNYNVVPTNYTKVATLTSTTGSTIGSQVQSTYAVFAATDQPAGTYNGKVKYTLVHPDDGDVPLAPQSTASGKICYYPNASAYEGTMGCQTVSTSATSATLFASNFSRTGYGFAGWSDAYDYATNSEAHFYGPNETISFAAGDYTGSNPGLSLYAVWVKSAGNFQDSSKVAELCGNGANALTAAAYNDEGDADESTWSITAGLSSISALTDTRDGQTYAIAKLTDGNCWMIENLRLADTHQEGGNTVPTTLTVANTNNPLNDEDSTNPTVTLKHNYSDTVTYATLSPTSSEAYNATTAPNGWCNVDASASCMNQSRLRTDNTSDRASTTGNSADINLYGYGNYYNWYSATAGRGNDRTYVVVEGDICPFGWHLPTGTGSGEYGLLSNSLGGYKDANDVAQYMSSSTTPKASIMDQRVRHFPNNIVKAGYAMSSDIYDRGKMFDYSTSSASGGNILYVFNQSGTTVFSPGTVNAGSVAKKYSGLTVRCIVNYQ